MTRFYSHICLYFDCLTAISWLGRVACRLTQPAVRFQMLSGPKRCSVGHNMSGRSAHDA
jgi:hypothetical protein